MAEEKGGGGMIYIGIDNGISGGLVALSDHPGPPIGMTPIPISRARKGDEVDVRKLFLWNSEATLVKLANWIKAVDKDGLEMAEFIGAKPVKVIKWGETFQYRDFMNL